MYRKSFDQTARNRMREKVTASIIFRERKALYARSVSHPFLGDYVRLRQNVQWKKISMENNDQYVVFADIINKITRSSGKVSRLDMQSQEARDEITSPFAVCANSISPVHQLDVVIGPAYIANQISSTCLRDLSSFAEPFPRRCGRVPRQSGRKEDRFRLPRLLIYPFPSLPNFQSEMNRKKGDFVFQTCHVIEIVTKLFLVIQNATAKPPEIHISPE